MNIKISIQLTLLDVSDHQLHTHITLYHNAEIFFFGNTYLFRFNIIIHQL